jgi:hypothetical protein
MAFCLFFVVAFEGGAGRFGPRTFSPWNRHYDKKVSERLTGDRQTGLGIIVKD